MMSAQQNDLITRIGPGTPCGELHAALLAAGGAGRRAGGRAPGQGGAPAGPGLRAVPRRAGPLRPAGPALPAPRRRPRLRPARGRRPALPVPRLAVRRDGPVPGDAGRARGQPALPHVRQPAYPVVARSGVLFAYLGAGEPPAFPDFDCFVAPDAYTFAFKGLWDCNWLQALEVGIDPAHASYLHRFFEDEDRSQGLRQAVPRRLRPIPTCPMTRVMREHARPTIEVEPTDYGLRILTTRDLGNEQDARARDQPDLPARLRASR